MSRKNVIKSYKMFDETSMASSQTSVTVNVINLDIASIFFEWSGSSPVGVLTLQARNGEGGTWYDLDMGGTMSVSGASGSHQLQLTEIFFTDLQLIYTRSSGTGSMTATITAKTIGA